MTSLDPHIFRAYDIRGKAYQQITVDACRKIGQAFGSTVREIYKIDHPKIALGRDARTHSPEFEDAVREGLIASGCEVLLIGQTPSPINYFTICNMQLDGGIHVTASHNPKEDNGLKLSTRNAHAFSGEDLQDLYKKIIQEDVLTGEGSAEEIDAITPYLSVLQEKFGSISNDLKIVIDSGNGVAGPVYKEGISQTGTAVEGLFIEPDGNFPNHPADPSKADTLKDLQKRVVETGADLGFAFDGDGDRLGLVDETGQIRTADEILLLLARDHLSRHAGKPVVFTVSNSGALESEITNWGGKPIMTTVGHSFVEHAMQEHDALLGGEQSGHFFCGEDYYGFDDALMAALRIIKIFSQVSSPKSLSSLMKSFPTVYQSPELRPDCADEHKSQIIEKIKEHFAKDYPVNDLDGARIDFGDGAWAGIRKSNTSPKLSICMEARSEKKLREVEEAVVSHLKMYPEISM